MARAGLAEVNVDVEGAGQEESLIGVDGLRAVEIHADRVDLLVVDADVADPAVRERRVANHAHTEASALARLKLTEAVRRSGDR